MLRIRRLAGIASLILRIWMSALLRMSLLRSIQGSRVSKCLDDQGQ